METDASRRIEYPIVSAFELVVFHSLDAVARISCFASVARFTMNQILGLRLAAWQTGTVQCRLCGLFRHVVYSQHVRVFYPSEIGRDSGQLVIDIVDESEALSTSCLSGM